MDSNGVNNENSVSNNESNNLNSVNNIGSETVNNNILNNMNDVSMNNMNNNTNTVPNNTVNDSVNSEVNNETNTNLNDNTNIDNSINTNANANLNNEANNILNNSVNANMNTNPSSTANNNLQSNNIPNSSINNTNNSSTKSNKGLVILIAICIIIIGFLTGYIIYDKTNNNSVDKSQQELKEEKLKKLEKIKNNVDIKMVENLEGDDEYVFEMTNNNSVNVMASADVTFYDSNNIALGKEIILVFLKPNTTSYDYIDKDKYKGYARYEIEKIVTESNELSFANADAKVYKDENNKLYVEITNLSDGDLITSADTVLKFYRNDVLIGITTEYFVNIKAGSSEKLGVLIPTDKTDNDIVYDKVEVSQVNAYK